jgi:hypothetical protein
MAKVGGNRRLTACERHPRRAEIDVAKGIGASTIARKYSAEENPISKWAAIRHVRDLKRRKPATLKALKAEIWRVTPEQLENLRLETSTGWLQQMRTQFSRVLRIQDGAVERGDEETALTAAREVARLLQMIGQAVKELQSGPTTLNVAVTTNNLIVSPAWHAVRNVLLDALRPHAAARADALAALQSIENADEAAPTAPLKLHKRRRS